MKILITIYHSLGYGGAEVSTTFLSRELEKLGHKVIIASTQKYEGFDTRLFKLFDKVPFYSYHEFYLGKFLRKIIKEEGVDVVYPQDRLTTIPAVIAAKKENKPIVVHFRDFWYACPRSSCMSPDNVNYDLCSYSIILRKFPKKRWLWDMHKWHYIKSSWKTLEDANAKICSSYMEKEKLELCKIKKNVNVVEAGRDIKKFQNINGMDFKKKYKFKRYIVSLVGTLSYTKGIPVMLKVIPLVIKENKDISFLIAGDGPMMDDMKEIIRENNLDDNVILVGRVQLEDVAKIYSISDVVLLPVIWREPGSGIPAEVGASGKPLIASNIGAIREMTEDFKILVEPFDYEGWKNAILKVVKDKKLKKKMGKIGREMVEKKYAMDVITDRINKILEGAVKNENPIM